MSEGEDVRDLVPVDDESIRLIHIEERFPIGAKRNFGCARASGEIIAHWDDDDYSAPGRLADQVARLQASGNAVTGYRSMRFTDGVESWRYQGTSLFAVGTSLCYRREWWREHPFPSRQIGEDNEFVSDAVRAGQLATAEAGDLMHASIHPGNTSPRQLSGASWIKL